MSGLILFPTVHSREPIDTIKEFYQSRRPHVLYSEWSRESESVFNHMLDRVLRSIHNPELRAKVVDYKSRNLALLELNKSYALEYGIEHVYAQQPSNVATICNELETVPESSDGEFDLNILFSSTDGYSKEAFETHYEIIMHDPDHPELLELIEGLTVAGKLGVPDRHMAKVVEAHYNPSQTQIFGVGMMHCCDSKKHQTLYSLLKKYSPERMLIV